MAIRLLQQTEGSRLSGSSQPRSSTSNDKSVSKTPAGRKRRKAGSPSRTVASPKKHCSDDSLVGEGVPSLKSAACFSGGAEKESIVLGQQKQCHNVIYNYGFFITVSSPGNVATLIVLKCTMLN